MIAGPKCEKYMSFSLISTRIATLSVFTLTFNVSDGPPTNVSCSVGDSMLPVRHFISREIINGAGFITQVTVTVESRQAGDYKCTVSNDRVVDGTFNSVTAWPSSSARKVSSEFYHFFGLYTYPQSSISCTLMYLFLFRGQYYICFMTLYFCLTCSIWISK